MFDVFVLLELRPNSDSFGQFSEIQFFCFSSSSQLSFNHECFEGLYVSERWSRHQLFSHHFRLNDFFVMLAIHSQYLVYHNPGFRYSIFPWYLNMCHSKFFCYTHHSQAIFVIFQFRIIHSTGI